MTNETIPPEQPGNNHKRARRIKIALTVIVLLAAGSLLYWWIFHRNRVLTDDAYARADSARVGSRVPGTVRDVFVDNDHAVRVDQVLVELDPADYQAAVDRARAILDQDEAELRAAEIQVPPVNVQTASQVDAAEAVLKAARDTEQQTRYGLDQLKNGREAQAADLSQAERDFRRFENLYQTGAGTRRQYEQAKTTYDRLKAHLKATDAQIFAAESALAAAAQQVARSRSQLQSVKSERSNVEVQQQRVEALKARRDKSRAELNAALLNLSYCRIVAPIDGYIAQKNIQVGDRIQPGQAIMAVVPLHEIYIEANYKETQLTCVRIGQPATISADIYPDYRYKGKVAGIRAGTGAAFSLIPPENATGNWIKVVQRIPVKIELDQPPSPDHPLRVGASLKVTIDITDRSGPQLLSPDPVDTVLSSQGQ